MSSRRVLGLGEPLRLVRLASSRMPSFSIGACGGRFLLLCVVSDLDHRDTRAAIALMKQAPFDETVRVAALLAGVPGAERDALVSQLGATHVVFFDADRVLADDLAGPEHAPGRWILFDPSLRSVAIWPMAKAAEALAALAATPAPDAHAGVPLHAPVLLVPRVFEPVFCRRLISYYDAHGGEPSGTTRENDAGQTYVALHPELKRRSDCRIDDEPLQRGCMQRIFWRLLPQVERAFMWRATRMERHIVARYDGRTGGFFGPHRDNTTKGTAHRRFAVTINLNTKDYAGGDLRFPEFGSRTYRAPTGGAVVFACALLHEATPVTRGHRYAFLPFLYDESDAAGRLANNDHLDASIDSYRAGGPALPADRRDHRSSDDP
jgi:predicted 2-oxoglutarate/Fe(II)-dependent dioxygenase YbiX